jgi:hypothetical protein
MKYSKQTTEKLTKRLFKAGGTIKTKNVDVKYKDGNKVEKRKFKLGKKDK